ncbi:hypothetical protein BEWA_000770 [Theileria equi strain WA]|uniref:Uncharacterized protein n=1 Tax=Theileria equi strain WA TaxID=1537102 RepID=L0AYK0_THEEQ|nr:hypothetical protein BEWA_000770 [Theileria equi strain WA]AFZ80672.1 hypothetical protein BEWA_000770 [Theileria equi strain WA]|eukprot:XP_004830338.1 hypothetical protein BEWA_000770 [Theileria equi strain WA]
MRIITVVCGDDKLENGLSSGNLCEDGEPVQPAEQTLTMQDKTNPLPTDLPLESVSKKEESDTCKQEVPEKEQTRRSVESRDVSVQTEPMSCHTGMYLMQSIYDSDEQTASSGDEWVYPELKTPQRVTIDITEKRMDLYKTIHYECEQNSIRLILPHKDIRVDKVASDGIILSEFSSTEALEYIKAYLNIDGKPELVIVMFTDNGNLRSRNYARKKEEWERNSYNYITMIKDLQFDVSMSCNCLIDVGCAVDNENCTIFDADILGLYTRFFFPKSGHVAREVRYNQQILWTANQGEDGKCISCAIYTYGTTSLLFFRVKVGEGIYYRWFDKVDGSWKEVERFFFFRKKEEMAKNRAETRARWAENGFI